MSDNPCVTCPEGQTRFCLPAQPGTGRPDFLVVTDFPITHLSQTLEAYKRRLTRAGIDVERCVFTSAVKCYGKNWTAGKKHCAPILEADIAHYRPKGVITFGERAIHATFEKSGNDKHVGNVVKREVAGHTFWSTHALDNDHLDKFPELIADDAWAISRLNDIAADRYPRRPERHNDYRFCDTRADFEQWVQEQGILPGDLIAFDIETGGTTTLTHEGKQITFPVGIEPLHPDSYILGVSICKTPGHAAYITADAFDFEWLRDKWLVTHNGSYDLGWIWTKHGLNLIENMYADTMLMSHNLREWSRSHSLKWLASRFLPEFEGYEDELTHWFESQKIAKARRDFADIPPDLFADYAAADADATRRLFDIFSTTLVSEGRWEFHREHIIPMQQCYAEIEHNGWGHDREVWQELIREAQEERDAQLEIIRNHPSWDRYRRWKEWSFRNEGKVYWDEDSNEAYVDSSCQEFARGAKYQHKNGKRVVKRTYLREEISPDPTKDAYKRTILFHHDFLGLPAQRVTPKKKEPKVDAATLRELAGSGLVDADTRALINAMLDLETVAKRLSTFLIPAYPHLDPKGNYVAGWIKADGLIHPQYLMAGHDFGSDFTEGGTSSGRISSRAPNMTNIPSRKGGKKIKKQFVAAPRDCHGNLVSDGNEWHIIQLDYSQLELRVLADFSGEPFMVDAYQNDEDLHRQLACQLFERDKSWYIERLGDDDHPEHDLAYNERLIAKTAWFAVIYGSGAAKLLDILGQMDVVLGATEEEALARAKEIIALLYRKLPYVSACKDQVAAGAPVHITEFMRRRTVFNINSVDSGIAQKGERQLFNFSIQSRGSDYFHHALIKIWRWLKTQRQHGICAYLMGTVHDSMILSAPLHEVDYITANCKRIMEDTTSLAWTLKVPLKADAETGRSWGDLRGWEPSAA